MGSLIGRIDDSVINSIKKWPPELKSVLAWAGYAGEPAVIMPMAFLALIYSFVQNRHRTLWAFLIAIVALLAVVALKQFMQRARPDSTYVRHMWFKSYSFPSWHAFGAVVTYGLLAYLSIQHLAGILAYPVVIILLFLILLIGVSRVYFEAHYPTDVLGGWLLGSLVLVFIVRTVYSAGA